MTDDLLIWEVANVPNACLLGKHSEIEDPWDITKGVSRVASFPDDFTYVMHPDYPYDTLLTDNLQNNDGWIVVSTRVKEFLEARKLEKVEYLAVTILDHRNRPASRDRYFVVHALDPVDCIDVAASKVRFSSIDTTRIKDIAQVILDETRLDPNRELFKLKFYYDIVIVRRSLAKALDDAGFTGLKWKKLSDHHD